MHARKSSQAAQAIVRATVVQASTIRRRSWWRRRQAPKGKMSYSKYHASAIDVPRPEVDRLAALAGKYRVYLVMGVMKEKDTLSNVRSSSSILKGSTSGNTGNSCPQPWNASSGVSEMGRLFPSTTLRSGT
ncbi:hypothetical protein CDL15_Pgr025210 [Punica granatum]|uniref:Uncharacterized protein n=1 Tax=Punica granatum TaxID=22663 RepID=A0A218W903_PUNGR|nr:hypothetical protein CDL15_Pgr025210 [Punica granatum]